MNKVFQKLSLGLLSATLIAMSISTSATATAVHSCEVPPNMTGCDFSNQNLSGRDLSNANLSNANLTNTNLSNANLTNTNLSGANLVGVKSGSISGVPVNLIKSYKIIKGYLVGPAVNLTGADLTNANLAFANLTCMPRGENYSVMDCATISGAKLQGANLTNAKLSGLTSGPVIGTPRSLPTDYKLTKQFIVGPDLNLSGADLSNGDLTNMNLSGVNLDKAILTGATLTGVYSGGEWQDSRQRHISGTPKKLPVDWKLVGGYLLGPKANLSNANLSNKNLTGVNLSEAKLDFTDLSSTNLTRAKFKGAHGIGIISEKITGRPLSLPNHIKLTGGFLVGPDVIFAGKDLSSANFTGADLRRANLSRSIMKNTDFSDANLTDANLTRSDLTGANFANSNLNGAFLRYADLTGANVTGANLNAYMDYVVSSSLVGVPAKISTGWKIVKGVLTQ